MVFEKAITNCPYCKADSCFYFRVWNTTFMRCLSCGLVFKEKSNSYQSLISLYQRDHFGGNSSKNEGNSRTKLFNYILDVVESQTDKGRLIDFGSGQGAFLAVARDRGWRTVGIEPSEECVRVASQRGLEMFQGTAREYSGNSEFDAVTLINVLDQSAEPWAEIDRVRELLKPGGLVYARFPNGSFHAGVYHCLYKSGIGESFVRFLIFHEYSLNSKFVRRLLTDKGFIRIHIRSSPPSHGDSYRLFQSPILAKNLKKIASISSRALDVITKFRVCLGTSLEVLAIMSPLMSRAGAE